MKFKYIATIQFFTALFAFMHHNSLQAQAIKTNQVPTVIGSAGGIAVNASLSLEWTLGETFVTSDMEGEKWYTQGFHQPFLGVYPDRNNQTESNYKIQISPNPTQDRLNISIQTTLAESIWLRLVDVTGKTILNQIAPPGTSSVSLSLNNLPGGLYLLSVINPKGYRVDSFKVIKQ